MSAVLHSPMSMLDFLAWEARQDIRWEFDGIGPVAMNGGSFAHERIGTRLRTLLDMQLMDKPCRVLGPTMKIEVAGRIRYPDAFVSCGPVAPDATVIRDPVVVFEVLSPSTDRTDRVLKLREYQATPSIQRYVILEQSGVVAWVLTRARDAEGNPLDAPWTITGLKSGDLLALPEIDVTIPLADLYAGAGLPAD